MIGESLFYDFARVGATLAPFQSFVLSAGVVTDYVYGVLSRISTEVLKPLRGSNS